MQVLFESGRFLYALFFAHLVIEMLLKAHWIKDHSEDSPPRTHNLEFLQGEISVSLPDEFLPELRIISSWNIEGRYPDFLRKISKNTTKKYAEEKLVQVDLLRKWLLENIH